jgi:hypothetical protein
MLPSFMLSCGALNSRLRPQTHGGPILWPSRLDCCVIAVEPPVDGPGPRIALRGYPFCDRRRNCKG